MLDLGLLFFFRNSFIYLLLLLLFFLEGVNTESLNHTFTSSHMI